MKQKVHRKYKDYFNKPITHYSEAVNLHQIEELANQKFSQQTYTYYTTGAMNGESYEENEHAFKRYKILPKVLVDVDGVDISTTILGEKISLPIIIAPTAMHNLAHFNGELETAKAANEMDTIICLSTMSSVSKSTIAKVAKHKWKQLYMPKDLKLAEKTIQSIEKDGYTVLVLTVDAPVMGIRDLENHGKFEGPDKRDSKTKTGTVESGLGQFFKRSFNSVRNFYLVNGLVYYRIH